MRVCLTPVSRNDYRFRNRDKKENIYDEEHRIIGQYHPTERNRSGAFRDIHLQQGLYRTTRGGDRWASTCGMSTPTASCRC